MAPFHPSSAVLRLADVAGSKSALEAALGVKLDRYEPARKGSLNYAQMDLNDGWDAIVDRIQTVGPQISALRRDGVIGAAAIDLPVLFDESLAALSVQVPSHVAEAVGRYAIDIEISIYLTNERGSVRQRAKPTAR